MYLLDSNVLTEAKNRYYAFGICPGFWDWLRLGSANGVLASVEKIRDEINDGAGRDLRFWQLVHAFSVFYPKCEEKTLGCRRPCKKAEVGF